LALPINIRPRVNEAREFLEIAKDFKDPKEIIREALSNSWDAAASKFSIKFSLARISGTRKNKIQVEIADDGSGMSSKPRAEANCSEIEGFFNLGDSYKPSGSIGSKGHGTKIYYKSRGIKVDTWKDGKHIHAEMEVPPWDSLVQGCVPTYCYDEDEDAAGRGTVIVIDGFQAKQSEFMSIDNLRRYIQWYTVVGSFANYFNVNRQITVEIKPADSYSPVTLPFGFTFPPEQKQIDGAMESACKIFGPKRISCGENEAGREIHVEIVGAILGEDHRNVVPETYSHMGLWLAKDYIRIERNNDLIEEVFKGQYYYRSMLIFANCQSFDLTANRNNIRTDQEDYDLALKGIKDFLAEIKEDGFTQEYFSAKKDDEEEKKRKEEENSRAGRTARAAAARRERINTYKGRANTNFPAVTGCPVKEPKSEVETALLLQAMISSNHPGIDFVIGDYNASYGVDLVVEMDDKDIASIKWAELVSSLDKLFAWSHPPEGYHVIVCYQLGNMKEVQTFSFSDGTTAKLVRKEGGRHALVVGSETIEIYVLREILEARKE
jgi:hypothetical protein